MPGSAASSSTMLPQSARAIVATRKAAARDSVRRAGPERGRAGAGKVWSFIADRSRRLTLFHNTPAPRHPATLSPTSSPLLMGGGVGHLDGLTRSWGAFGQCAVGILGIGVKTSALPTRVWGLKPMGWGKEIGGFCQLRRLSVVLALGALTAGCFQPLYGNQTIVAGDSVRDKL